MYREVVVGIDFGASSLAAARWVARELAPNAHLHLVHVIPDPAGSPLLRPYVPEGLDPFRDVHDIYQALSDLARSIGQHRVEVDILEGLPADALGRAAAEVGADLICVGKSRQRRGSGRFGATTPHRLLARTSVPVLTVPEAPHGRPAAVLAAVSDGCENTHVLDTAARIAGAHGAHLDVLHALEADVQAAAAAAQRLGCHARLPTIAQNWLAAQVKRLPRDRPSTTTLAPFGDAGEEIVAHAARGHVGLIVAGRCRERDPRQSVISLGSSARLLLWAAPCPVLLLDTVGADGRPRGRRRASRFGRRHAASTLAVVTGGDAA